MALECGLLLKAPVVMLLGAYFTIRCRLQDGTGQTLTIFQSTSACGHVETPMSEGSRL